MTGDVNLITGIQTFTESWLHYLELACEAFFDPMLYVLDEDEYLADELREKVIGLTRDWRLLYVVYVMREDRIRLISARETTPAERMLYETQ